MIKYFNLIINIHGGMENKKYLCSPFGRKRIHIIKQLRDKA